MCVKSKKSKTQYFSELSSYEFNIIHVTDYSSARSLFDCYNSTERQLLRCLLQRTARRNTVTPWRANLIYSPEPLTFDLGVKKRGIVRRSPSTCASAHSDVTRTYTCKRARGLVCEQLLGATSSSSSSAQFPALATRSRCLLLLIVLLLLTGASQCPPLFASHNEGWIR